MLMLTPFVDSKYFIVLFLSWTGAHQGASFYFYMDRAGRSLVASSPLLIIIPLVICIGSIALFYIAGPASSLARYYGLILSAISIYHFQKQNIGVYSFWCIANGDRATEAEKTIIKFAATSGILASWLISGDKMSNTILQGYDDVILKMGAVLCVVACFAGLYNVSRQTAVKYAFKKSTLFLCCVGFYVPAFLISDQLLAFAIYGTAHGIQYFYLLLAMTANDNLTDNKESFFNTRYSSLIALIVTALVMYGVMTMYSLRSYLPMPWSTSPDFLNGLIGLALGVSLSHFYIDSQIWRMSDPRARKFVKEKIGFLFS
jgi:hypothetical protein